MSYLNGMKGPAEHRAVSTIPGSGNSKGPGGHKEQAVGEAEAQQARESGGDKIRQIGSRRALWTTESGFSPKGNKQLWTAFKWGSE